MKKIRYKTTVTSVLKKAYKKMIGNLNTKDYTCNKTSGGMVHIYFTACKSEDEEKIDAFFNERQIKFTKTYKDVG